jgi:hypothetical protein
LPSASPPAIEKWPHEPRRKRRRRGRRGRRGRRRDEDGINCPKKNASTSMELLASFGLGYQTVPSSGQFQVGLVL